MKTLNLKLCKSRPRSAPKNGNNCITNSALGKGYLVLDGATGILRENVVYVFFEQARYIAGNTGRVVPRKWYEKRMNRRIVTGAE